MKTCNLCQKEKPISEFHIYHRLLVSGERVKRRAAFCRECNKKRSKEWRERKKREGKAKAINKRNYEKAKKDPKFREKRRAIDKAYRERHYEKVRERDREKAAARRREQGVKSRGPWKKYREKPASKVNLPIEPLQEHLVEIKISANALSKLTNIDQTTIEKIMRGREFRGNGVVIKKGFVTEETVDRILLALHEPHMFNELYPLEDNV